ncbi:DUF3939 domain-containing protein [Paenibacillus barengoltzii]|uniref:DUF3939 domain-containing protein n=1 Tax=Paenibacillus barengoltzii G22 TaxID=1235795 RepID=R9LEV4_9BACL|nr:DUF3939 domain-containing protein [Paenibacillus barengoltzii]EOS56896.1 hypothetical protein C812_01825 [Paenibacillus barengoltzii G22]SMF02076.1 Protein of unknown function [Paenibacillus barengoltzii]
MLSWFKKRKPKQVTIPTAIKVTLDEVRRAVLRYEADMPEGINRLSLLLPDGSLDMKRLSRYLGGVTDQRFYLSRETYEIFPEEERDIPYYLDMVQAAVDHYVEERGKLPVLEDSRQLEVDYRLLVREHYLKEMPPFPLYVTDQEMLLTHRPKQVI